MSTESTPVIHLVEEDIDATFDLAIELAEAALAPAGEAAVREMLEVCCEVLSCKRPSVPALTVYSSLLGQLPADLLAKAGQGALMDQDYHKLPTPGGFFKPVAEEWDNRKSRLSRLRRHRERVRMARRYQRPSLVPPS